MDKKIELFQTDRIWPLIREQVLHMVDQEHAQGRAQNGSLIANLESRLADKFGRRYCVSFGTCSDALTASVISLELPIGAHVGVSDYTFSASAHAIARAGMHVIPLDVNDDYCIASHEKNLSAVMAVDIFGNMSSIDNLAVPVIVDCAQSLESHDGRLWSAKRGVISCVSFSPSKTVSSWGSGGAALTDDENHYQKLKKLRLHGKTNNDDASMHAGMNSMISSFEAACILAGLEHADSWRQRRQQISQYIRDRSIYATGIDFDLYQHTFHKLVFRSDQRDNVIAKLKNEGIYAAVHYRRLIHQEPLYPGHICKNSARLSRESFTVPNQHTLTDSEVEKIAKALL